MWTGVTFVAALVAGFVLLDGNVNALANRLTAKRDVPPTGAGPSVGGAPLQVAQADEDDDEDAGGGGGDATVDSGDGNGGGVITPSKLIDDNCVGAGCAKHALDGFRDAVAKAKAGKLGRPLRISYYGDSVIATDAIPAHLRRKVQKLFGDGGPGFVFAMPPHRFCVHEDVVRTATGTWIPHAVSTVSWPDGFYGVANGGVDSAGGAGVKIKIKTEAVSSVDVYYLAQPGGGTVSVTSGGSEIVKASMAADAKAPGYAAGAISGGSQELQLSVTGKARVYGLDLERASGAVVDNLGVVSVNAKNFANNDATHMAAEIAHRGSDLIMIMIGANEAQWLHPGDRDMKDYQARYERVLQPIRKGRPDASCLVISPLDQAEAKDGGYASRPVMPYLVDAQRKAAAAVGCAFYDAYTWQGGKGAALAWFKKGWVGGDFEHLTRKGAGKMADGIYAALGFGNDGAAGGTAH